MVNQLHGKNTLELRPSNDLCSLKNICVEEIISY